MRRDTNPDPCPETVSRRAFLGAAVAAAAKGSAVALGLPAILAACERADEARRAGAGLKNLGAEEAAEFRAIAARIMPSDETPGAEEAGVIHFMDHALTEPEQLKMLRGGLADLQRQARERYGAGGVFHQLEPERQDALLRAIEDGEFFGTLRFLTMAGMFCLPEYGGNRNLAGYRMLGFDSRHAWTPPFGYYDAQRQTP